MADEPESDAEVPDGADDDGEEPDSQSQSQRRPSEEGSGTADDGTEDRESDEGGGSDGAADAHADADGSGSDGATDGDSDSGDDSDSNGDDPGADTADSGTEPDEDDDSDTIEGTGVEDRMSSYADSIDMPGGPGEGSGGGGDDADAAKDDEDEDEENADAAPEPASDDAPTASSHVGGGDGPEPERLSGYDPEGSTGADGDGGADRADGTGGPDESADDGGTLTPVDGEINREYDEDELADEFGSNAVDPPAPSAETEVTDGAGAAPTAAEDGWVEDDWDEEWTDSGIVGEGPESDEEMPLADHIEEMVGRVGVVLLIGLTVSLAVFGLGEVSQYIPSSVEIVEYLWQEQVPAPDENRPHVYGPLELLLTQLKVAGLTGVVVGLPVFVYESYLFMRPGLYPKERRYYLASVPTSLVLALLGVLFAHFIILPNLFDYFTFYTNSAADGNILVAYGLQDTFTLILVMMGYMAVIFQIPLFIMLAIMMGITTREWMEERRLLFWGAFLGLSFTFVAVDPTGMAPIVIAVTMVVLFESTLALLRWTGN